MQATPPGSARRAFGALLGLAAAIVWTHALAGVLRSLSGVPAAELAPASSALTLAAVASALAGAALGRSPSRAALVAAVTGFAAALCIAGLVPGTLVPAFALVPAGAAAGILAVWFARRLSATFDADARRRPRRTLLWLALGVLALVQLGRLGTYITDAESDWFLSTRHPFYAKHECANAYVFGAELALRGEPNLYDPAHYPGLTPEATPETDVVGMAPEDPYQYPPQFLLLPGLALVLTHDYGAIRALWFGLNVTLCLSAVLVLAGWVGGRTGRITGLLTPAVFFSFPVLHDFQYGQFHFAAVALAVLGIVAIQCERTRLGGSLLGTAILAKLFPAVLLVPLALRGRWRALGWTAGASAALTGLTLLFFGTGPFTAFFGEHLGRLSSGSAFAFGEAWPEVADLVTAGNQGVHGVVHKLSALGFVDANAALLTAASRGFALFLLALALVVGRTERGATRHERATAWLGLLGLGSLASAGAWADYVPLTAVWALAFLAPLVTRHPRLRVALAVSALFQVFLIGTMPIGSAADASWMLPLSLLGSLALFATLTGAALVPVLRSHEVRIEEPAAEHHTATPTRGLS